MYIHENHLLETWFLLKPPNLPTTTMDSWEASKPTLSTQNPCVATLELVVINQWNHIYVRDHYDMLIGVRIKDGFQVYLTWIGSP